MTAYELLKQDYLECMSTWEDRYKYCPPKTVLSLDGKTPTGVTASVLPAMDRHGNFGSKTIYLNDCTGEVREFYVLNGEPVNYTGMTRVRCALMNRLAMDLMGKLDACKIGFIGNGKTNLTTACMLKGRQFVIHGSKRDRGKNLDRFSKYGPTEVDEDFSKLKDCDVTFVCTNSLKQEDMIDRKEIGRDIVVLDCGYCLSEWYRDDNRFFRLSDFPEQLETCYEEEFPYDKEVYSFAPLARASEYNRNPFEVHRAVYMHGVGIADLSLAKHISARGVKNLW